MRHSILLVPSLLASLCWATSDTCPSGICNQNRCLRAVKASSLFPYSSSASADCSSFLLTTVVPCPSTSTTVETVTATDLPYTVTVTTIIDNTDLYTTYDTLTDFTTLEATLTTTQPSEVDVTNTIFSTITSTADPNLKRDQDIKPLPVLPSIQGVNARAFFTGPAASPTQTTGSSPTQTTTSDQVESNTCTATTQTVSDIPNYASACSNTATYSSACSCNGITGGTTTLTQSTVIVTSTSTVQYTPTATAIVSSTYDIQVTVVETQTVPGTVVTTDATLIIPSVYTQTTEIIVPTTVVVSPPACSTYNFVATNGARAGQFLQGDTPDPSAISYGFVDFTADPAAASSFTLRSDGTIYANDVYGWVTDSDSLYYILQMTDRSYSTYGTVGHLTCTIGSGDTSYPGAIGTLSCDAYGHSISLVYCDSTSNDLLQTTSTDDECTSAGLVAIEAC